MPRAGPLRHRELFEQGTGMSCVEIARRVGASIINLWRRRQGVRPNRHHLLVLLDLASEGEGAQLRFQNTVQGPGMLRVTGVPRAGRCNNSHVPTCWGLTR